MDTNFNKGALPPSPLDITPVQVFKCLQNLMKTVTYLKKDKSVGYLPISLGSDVKSLIGIGIFLQMYSHMTSILYFNCADIGMTGAFSAIVPMAHNTYQIFMRQY